MIIVVEDEPTINELICNVLTDEGYTALGCSGEDEALSLITTYHPDLVITDLLLGEGQSGVSLLNTMHIHATTTDIPVLICSCALGLLQEIKDDVQSANYALLEKPFNIDDLIAGVQAALSDTLRDRPLLSLVV